MDALPVNSASAWRTLLAVSTGIRIMQPSNPLDQTFSSLYDSQKPAVCCPVDAFPAAAGRYRMAEVWLSPDGQDQRPGWRQAATRNRLRWLDRAEMECDRDAGKRPEAADQAGRRDG